MKFPYNRKYELPFPAVKIILRNDEEGLQTEPLDALLDTGSDGSLVPIEHLRQILAPAVSDTRIRSHWGEWRSVQLFMLDIEVSDLKLPAVFVVGDEQGDEIILGRNVLNMIRLSLHGPALLTDIPKQ